MMDPVTLIVAAVMAGVSAGVTDTVKGEVKAAYTALRTKLFERFRDNDLVKRSITDIEKDPSEQNAKYLAQSIEGKGITQDDELVTLAKDVVAAGNISVDVLTKLGRKANVTDSGAVVEGASDQSRADVTIRHEAGEESVIKDSGVKITYRPATGR